MLFCHFDKAWRYKEFRGSVLSGIYEKVLKTCLIHFPLADADKIISTDNFANISWESSVKLHWEMAILPS